MQADPKVAQELPGMMHLMEVSTGGERPADMSEDDWRELQFYSNMWSASDCTYMGAPVRIEGPPGPSASWSGSLRCARALTAVALRRRV